jgi:hypothetical protein
MRRPALSSSSGVLIPMTSTGSGAVDELARSPLL